MQSLEGWLSLYFYRYIQNIQKRRETKQGSDKILRSWIITLQDLYDVVKLLWFGDTWKDINGGQQEGRPCASSDSFFKYPLMLAIQAESDDRKTASQNFFRDQVLCSWTSDESTKSTKNILGTMLFPVLSCAQESPNWTGASHLWCAVPVRSSIYKFV